MMPRMRWWTAKAKATATAKASAMATATALALGASPLAAAQTVATAGACPGTVSFTMAQGTPGGKFALLTGGLGGNSALPAGPCAGTVTGLAGVTLRATGTYDALGAASLAPTLPAGACGLAVQVVDTPVAPIVAQGDGDGDGVAAGADCDDADPTVFPGADEVCDGVDNDCDASTREDGLIRANGVTYTSIDEAVFRAGDGSVIDVCAGTYTETVTIDHPVVVRGAGSGEVTLDAAGVGLAIFVSANDVTIEGMTVTGGVNPLSGGGLTAAVRGLVVRDVVFVANEANAGGGVYLTSAVASFEDVAFLDNVAAVGGGLYALASTVDCTACRFDGNTAEYGAALTTYGAVSLIDTVVTGNASTNGHGPVYVGSGSLAMTGGEISSNTASTWGGGLYVNAPTTLTDVAVIGNSAVSGGGAYIVGSNTLALVNVDLGVGPTENQPDDVYFSTSGSSLGNLQSGVTVTCVNGGCN